MTGVAAAEGARDAGLSSSNPELEDDSVVRRVLAGDTRAFELLMRRHNRRLFRVARSIVRSDNEAEDVMQHSYVRAFEHLSSYQGRALFSTWLTRIAIHEALARRRKLRVHEPLDELTTVTSTIMSAAPTTPESDINQRELRHVLEASIDELPEEFRVVFVLRAVEQLSVAEVASCLQLPADTVKTRFFRARLRLRQSLSRRLDLASPDLFDFHLSRCDRVVQAVFAWIERERTD